MASEKRLIDANAIKYTLEREPGGWGGEPQYIVTQKEIDGMPAVDAVEVVRCKDCKKREICRTTNIWAVAPSDDWYCADGGC